MAKLPALAAAILVPLWVAGIAGCGASANHPPPIGDGDIGHAPVEIPGSGGGAGGCQPSPDDRTGCATSGSGGSAGHSSNNGYVPMTPAAHGNHCTSATDCADNAWCNGQTSTCEPLAPWGESCNSDAQCGQLACVTANDGSSARSCGLAAMTCDSSNDCTASKQACEAATRGTCLATCTHDQCQVSPG